MSWPCSGRWNALIHSLCPGHSNALTQRMCPAHWNASTQFSAWVHWNVLGLLWPSHLLSPFWLLPVHRRCPISCDAKGVEEQTQQLKLTQARQSSPLEPKSLIQLLDSHGAN